MIFHTRNVCTDLGHQRDLNKNEQKTKKNDEWMMNDAEISWNRSIALSSISIACMYYETRDVSQNETYYNQASVILFSSRCFSFYFFWKLKKNIIIN